MSAVPHQSVQFGCPHCGCKLTIPAHAGPLEGPCPRCAKPIRAAASSPETSAPTSTAQPSPPVVGPFQPSQVQPTQTPLPRQQPAVSQHQQRPLHCECPSCGHHHPFAADQLGQVAQCSGCLTAIRLPQKPTPEVPLKQEIPAQPKADTSPKALFPPKAPSPTEPQIPAQLQSTYDSVVQTLHDYEEAGVPSDHPDRLHLLEQFFKSFSPGDSGNAPEPPPLGHGTVNTPLGGMESQGRPVRSHLPPRKDGCRPEIQPRAIPPVRRTERPTPPQALGEESPTPGPAESFRPYRALGQNRVERHLPKAPPMESARLLKRRRNDAGPFALANQNAGRSSRFRKIALFGVVAVIALIVAYVAHDLYETKKQQAVEFEPASMLRDNLPAPPPLTMAEQHEIKDLVHAFHRARSPEAKASLVVDGFRMLEPMASFYEVHGIEPSEVSIDPYLAHIEQGDTDYFRGTGAYANGRTIEFFAMRQGDEFLLDWPSLSGYSDMNWSTFISEKPALPMEFRVVASKLASNGAVSGQDMVLALHAPGGDEKVIGYADTASLAGGELDRVFDQYGESPVKLTVKLAYAGKRGSDPRLVVTEVVRKDWLALASSM